MEANALPVTWPGAGETEIRVLRKNMVFPGRDGAPGRLGVAGETVNVPKVMVAGLVTSGALEAGAAKAEHRTLAQIRATAAPPAPKKRKKYVTTDDVEDITGEVDPVPANEGGYSGIMPAATATSGMLDALHGESSSTARRQFAPHPERASAGRNRSL